jgi:hypothetical protein
MEMMAPVRDEIIKVLGLGMWTCFGAFAFCLAMFLRDYLRNR